MNFKEKQTYYSVLKNAKKNMKEILVSKDKSSKDGLITADQYIIKSSWLDDLLGFGYYRLELRNIRLNLDKCKEYSKLIIKPKNI